VSLDQHSPFRILKPADGPADSSNTMQLLTRNQPTTAVTMRRLAFVTSEPIQLHDITDEASETVPVMDGELMLGEWQRIFLVELDGPREKREVLVQTVGIANNDFAR
jgi:hypothetical protein